jgi:hypothetical protein
VLNALPDWAKVEFVEDLERLAWTADQNGADVAGSLQTNGIDANLAKRMAGLVRRAMALE